MPDIFDVVRERRSVRKYQIRQVPKDIIEEVLASAGWAPSAHNAQPWRFIILVDLQFKRRLAEAMAESWAADMAKEGATIDIETRKARVEQFVGAPLLILGCLTMDGMKNFPDKRLQSCERDLALQSFGASIQNLLLAAQAKGLGACWFCAPAFSKETVRKALGIPDEVEPQALVAMGYPVEKPAVPQRNLLSEYCFKETWGRTLS